MTATTIDEFWQEARAVLGDDLPEEPPPAWGFGDTPELQGELLALVLEGKKTATCEALWQFEADGEPVPTPGDLSIILDGAGTPRCVIETAEIRVMPMNEVDPQFAYDEGEGDRTWETWYAEHEIFFGRTMPRIGRAFDPTMP
ncbi:MAG: ASCH domain-containing protein, partial [Geminicoccales bacterium]